MATKLTTPEGPVITHQAVTYVHLTVPHKLNELGTDLVIDTANVTIGYRVLSYDELSNVLNEEWVDAPWPELSPLLKADFKAVYIKAEQNAVTRGLISAGITEDMEAT